MINNNSAIFMRLISTLIGALHQKFSCDLTFDSRIGDVRMMQFLSSTVFVNCFTRVYAYQTILNQLAFSNIYEDNELITCIIVRSNGHWLYHTRSVYTYNSLVEHLLNTNRWQRSIFNSCRRFRKDDFIYWVHSTIL